MQQKVQTYIQKHHLLIANGKIIVGVSGGIDSVVLIHVLKSLGYDCVIAHCNFHLRMDESLRDEEFVRNLAHSYSIPFYRIDFETTKYAEEHKISIEMAARDLRYAWFTELLDKLDAQAIAVGHHADDNIETMLMHLVRGTGLKGLAGMQPRHQHVVRPLLGCTRPELEDYMILHDLEHVEDSTNASSDYQRNKFRNEVIPLLMEINPSVRETLYQSIEHLNGNLSIYQQAIEEISKRIVEKNGGQIKMNIELIKKQVDIPTIMYELLYPYGFSTALIEQITERLDAESGKIFYSETYKLIKDRKYLIISPKDLPDNQIYFISETDSELHFPLNLKIKRFGITPDFEVSRDNKCIHIDTSDLVFPLLLRRWNEGDTFYPFGMKKRKKLSDFFIDSKLSLIDKENSWLLVSGNEIVWIVGLRLDNRFRVTPETSEVLEIKIL